MKSSRNAPCPCGSGKKYKKCCQDQVIGQPTIAHRAASVIPSQQPSQAEQNQLIALYQARRYAELEAQLAPFLVRYPASGFGWKILSAAQSLQGKDSFYALQQAAALLPQDAEVLNNLGDVLSKKERLTEAEPYFRRAIKLKPGYADALHNLGVVLVQLGEIAESETCFRKVLEINPDNIEARYFIAQNKKAQPDDVDFCALVALGHRATNKMLALTEPDFIHLSYALGKGYDEIGATELAFHHYSEGARRKRRTFRYDSQAEARNVDELIRIFDAAKIERLRGMGDPSACPVFIVGMPRSGTTLTEQIIASHPDVHGAGELMDFANITQRNIAGVVYPGSLRLANQANLSAWANEYVAILRRHHASAKRITDKLPANFMSIGLIHAMLPNAKIIHVARNPVDTCWSCFTNLFNKDNVPWSYDLAELGAYYRNYARIMQHWHQTLPQGAFLEVKYEEIVQDRENQARRLIEYCDLEWNGACLESHKTERSVKTASLLQVRKPIYTTSVARWRRYEQHLSPLLEALGDMAYEI